MVGTVRHESHRLKQQPRLEAGPVVVEQGYRKTVADIEARAGLAPRSGALRVLQSEANNTSYRPASQKFVPVQADPVLTEAQLTAIAVDIASQIKP